MSAFSKWLLPVFHDSPDIRSSTKWVQTHSLNNIRTTLLFGLTPTSLEWQADWAKQPSAILPRNSMAIDLITFSLQRLLRYLQFPKSKLYSTCMSLCKLSEGGKWHFKPVNLLWHILRRWYNTYQCCMPLHARFEIQECLHQVSKCLSIPDTHSSVEGRYSYLKCLKSFLSC